MNTNSEHKYLIKVGTLYVHSLYENMIILQVLKDARSYSSLPEVEDSILKLKGFDLPWAIIQVTMITEELVIVEKQD